MARIIEVDGTRLELPDDATDADVAAILRQRSSEPQPRELKSAATSVPDAISSLGTGLVKGGAFLATAPQGMVDFGERMVGRGMDYARGAEPGASYAALNRNTANITPALPQQADVVGAIERNVTGPLPKPETTAGRYAQSIGEFAPMAMAGPGGILRNLFRYGVAPGVGSEAAGEATKGTPYEPAARIAGALGGMGMGSLATRPGTATGVIQEAMGGINQQSVKDAQSLMQDAAQRGITLTWPEAIQQATNGATKLADVQRVVEGSQSGGAVMRPVMAERPGQVDSAVRNQIDQIAPNAIDPFTVGPRAANAAGQTLQSVEGAINNSTRPAYQAAQPMPIDPAEYARIAASPSYQEAQKFIRSHPELGPLHQQFPDNSIGMIDAVKKLLQKRADVPITADATEKYLAANRGSAASDAVNTATRSNPDYAYALGTQAAAREKYLNPLMQGPMGRAAEAKTTESAVEALLPKAPLPGSEGPTAQAFRSIGRKDADAASNVVRQRLEGTYNQSARDLQGGPNEWGGSNFAAQLYGNPQAKANVQAAVTETAGPQVTSELDKLVEALRATGRRQHPGSQTESNRLLTRALEGGGTIGEVASSAAGRVNPLSYVRDRYQQYRYGANTDALARALIDPAMGSKIADLAASNIGSPQLRLLLAKELLNARPKE